MERTVCLKGALMFTDPQDKQLIFNLTDKNLEEGKNS